MCGLCGFGLADAELVLGRAVPNGQDTGQLVGQPAKGDSQNVAQPVSQNVTSGEVTTETTHPNAGNSQSNSLLATLWSRFRLPLSGHPFPSHSH